MRNTHPLLTNFLKTALTIQALPYAGIRVVNSTLLATDGYMLVAYKASAFTVRGEGMLHPLTAQAVLLYTGALDEYDALAVDGNAATLRVAVAKGVVHEVALPPFLCEIKPVERIFDKVENAHYLCNVFARDLLPRVAGEFVKVGDAGLIPATPEDDYRYSVAQIRKCATLFRARDEVMLSVTPDGPLVAENEWGLLFVVTPFRSATR